MTIGIDCGALSVTDKRLEVGVWRVTTEFLKQLSKIDKHNEYRLYSFLPIKKKLLKQLSPRMKNVVLSPSFGYMKLRLPIELMLHPVDCFIGLSQALPPLGKTKMIGVVYDLGFLHMKEKYGRSYHQLKHQTGDLVKRSCRIITISEASKKDIIATYGINKNIIDVCYPGIDKLYSPKGRKKKFLGPYFLYVGALKPAKNIPMLLTAFAMFLQKNFQYDLLLIGGDRWLDPEIHTTISQLQLKKYVRLLGHIPTADLPSYFRGATAFVSLGKWEGFGMTGGEALACGTPVVGANSGAMREVVGDAGVLVDPDNPKGIAEALGNIIHKKRSRAWQKQTAKQVKKFTWNAFGRLIHASIQNI